VTLVVLKPVAAKEPSSVRLKVTGPDSVKA
jgi:hypothetical protein